MHGDDDCGKSMACQYINNNGVQCALLCDRRGRHFTTFFLLTRFLPAAVGASLLRCCISDRNAAFSAAPNPIDRVYEPSLWGYTILCDQSLRSLRERYALQPTRAILFLAVLFLHEFYLDRGSILSVYPAISNFLGGADRLTLCIRLPSRQHPHSFGCDSGSAGVRREA